MANHISKSFPEVMTPDLWANKQVWFYVQGSPRLGPPSGADEAVWKAGAAGGALAPQCLEGCLQPRAQTCARVLVSGNTFPEGRPPL